ncbi:MULTISPECIES: VirB3 family type IV secretion system protein [Alphaproteobacteria]|jgi:type IV secretion system protein VirB3|uniref:Type IV secretion system protein VirB3 n=1 Tax=Ponticaulis profundi TaxID=2665222 RepID=A0ABW1SE49_9PROT|nr:VirB3 family type IV secretion system protein [Paracoccus sp. Arc7-R13]AZY95832.1 type IV secretion system protein VirB3 [Paracoccus sp. Arc7-R13]MBM3603328.1 type IV secretion system protein VirB3 [Alphaproteobacteria bacterium]|tara:strand:- start:3970 stop:4248 length:279 start_codon:yes stop_codon:yes gene_type:complete
MTEQDVVFKGLLRAPKFLGLPVIYGMVWVFSGVLLFIWIKSFWVLAWAAATYPALYAAAQWDPNFLDVIMTVLQKTRPSRNKNLWNGNSYEP